jgi:septal ring-binding cell division protein DamX
MDGALAARGRLHDALSRISLPAAQLEEEAAATEARTAAAPMACHESAAFDTSAARPAAALPAATLAATEHTSLRAEVVAAPAAEDWLQLRGRAAASLPCDEPGCACGGPPRAPLDAVAASVEEDVEMQLGGEPPRAPLDDYLAAAAKRIGMAPVSAELRRRERNTDVRAPTAHCPLWLPAPLPCSPTVLPLDC